MQEGQLASLIPDVAWDDPAALQRALRWAGRASAPKGRLLKATPFDQLERRLSHDRRATRDREARKVLSRWVLSTRAWQRRWRLEQELNEMTAQKKNIGKHKRQTCDLLLRDLGTSQARVGACQTVWQSILCPSEAGQCDVCSPPRKKGSSSAEERAHVPPHHEYDFTITHVCFVELVGRMAKGKIGADDGVLVEFLQKLSSEQEGRLLYLLQDILMGVIAAPASWKRASIALLPEIVGAIDAAEFRPIAILPVMQKVALNIWIHEAAPFLQLRRPSSVWFRPGFKGPNSICSFARLLPASRSGTSPCSLQSWTYARPTIRLRGMRSSGCSTDARCPNHCDLDTGACILVGCSPSTRWMGQCASKWNHDVACRKVRPNAQ